MQAHDAYQQRRQKRENENTRREQYNLSVSNAHQQAAIENARWKQVNEQRIKQLEEVEQRMVADLQRTLMTKNQAMNELANKSKSLKKVMQPRMAYKYSPRQSDPNQASQGGFMRRASNDQFASNANMNAKYDNVYSRRSKSIAQGVAQGVAPASG